MSDSREESAHWQKVVREYAVSTAANLRVFGIEITPDDAVKMVQDALLDCQRQMIRNMLWVLITRKKT